MQNLEMITGTKPSRHIKNGWGVKAILETSVKSTLLLSYLYINIL